METMVMEKKDKLIINSVESLTFDDVQLVPKFSTLESRSEAITTTQFTRNYWIDKPLIGSPMDSVCGDRMIKRLWELGCVGVIHRFMTIDEQVKQALDLWNHIESFRWTDSTNGWYRKRSPVICAAIGSNGDSLQRATRLIEEGHVNVLVIDVAHGHHENVRRIMTELVEYQNKSNVRFDIIAGNVATPQGAIDLELWGADAIRVGVGGGSVCETRIRTGVGIPQLSCVDEITSVVSIPIISDGGIRYPGDVAKALAVGAKTVMVGSLFAGTDEAPGEIFVSGQWPNNKNFKMYRGSASATMKMKSANTSNHVEGAAKMVECKGPVENMVNDIMDGVTSSMSYLGVKDIENMWTKAEFVRISSSGLREAHPHLL
jgi:IMP dehydrogenase